MHIRVLIAGLVLGLGCVACAPYVPVTQKQFSTLEERVSSLEQRVRKTEKAEKERSREERELEEMVYTLGQKVLALEVRTADLEEASAAGREVGDRVTALEGSVKDLQETLATVSAELEDLRGWRKSLGDVPKRTARLEEEGRERDKRIVRLEETLKVLRTELKEVKARLDSLEQRKEKRAGAPEAEREKVLERAQRQILSGAEGKK